MLVTKNEKSSTITKNDKMLKHEKWKVDENPKSVLQKLVIKKENYKNKSCWKSDHKSDQKSDQKLGPKSDQKLGRKSGQKSGRKVDQKVGSKKRWFLTKNPKKSIFTENLKNWKNPKKPKKKVK